MNTRSSSTRPIRAVIPARPSRWRAGSICRSVRGRRCCCAFAATSPRRPVDPHAVACEGMRTGPGPTDSIVVFGAGRGGLSAALPLAGAGRNVTVLERTAVPGGRAGLIHDHGYRFDTGPTVLTMPELVAQPLNAVGEELDDWLTLHRLDPAYRARFADGSTIHVRAETEAMAE